ncbi:hypothetical protein CKO15_13155 [Halorhodospira abdelmalekii]|uniref:InlB B-repeat-containing protein n=1 Tax=Halorhodospira abdelmalekii TaxID=421629 RepID=UPI0019067BD1|nr:hypothetical protein [Halorhodospira abdelmalekii]MBK1736198.1 hypothetical protein [Halorhodospira abdelmalekii]
MNVLIAILVLASMVFFALGMIKPRLAFQPNRKRVALIYGGVFLVASIIMGDSVPVPGDGEALLEITAEGSGDVEPSGYNIVEQGEVVRIAAIPQEGWSFSHWEGIESDQPEKELEVSEDKKLTAVFISNKVTLNLEVEGGGKTSPAGTLEVARGDTVDISADAEAGWEFSHWEGITSSSRTASFVADDNQKITAVFREVVSGVKFAQVRHNAENMTSTQWDDYRDEIIGLIVRWRGEVYDVRERRGGFEIQIDPDVNVMMSRPNITLRNVEDERAADLRKGSVITFTGRITRVNYLLGSVDVRLEDVEL